MADVKIVDIDNEQWNMKDQESRNKIAALEEKFNSFTVYSTSEVNTKQKWIDGKDIYRKVVSGISYGEGNLNIETGITDIDELINLSFIESGVTGTYAGRIYVGTNRAETSWFINKSTGVVSSDGHSTSVTGTNGILIIEYTKA